MEIRALGQTVILKAIAPSPGKEQQTQFGIILPGEQESKVPTHCEIFKIGPDVPSGLFNVGDKTPFPLGEKLNVPHPDVIQCLCKPEDRDEKFISVFYKNISCVYK